MKIYFFQRLFFCFARNLSRSLISSFYLFGNYLGRERECTLSTADKSFHCNQNVFTSAKINYNVSQTDLSSWRVGGRETRRSAQLVRVKINLLSSTNEKIDRLISSSQYLVRGQTEHASRSSNQQSESEREKKTIFKSRIIGLMSWYAVKSP